MLALHPFLKRIRLERTIISLVNKRADYLGSELTGLSREAVGAWFDGISEPVKFNKNTTQVRSKLEYIGQLTKLESNGSHRGAMIAPLPNENIAKCLLNEISETIEKMPSNMIKKQNEFSGNLS